MSTFDENAPESILCPITREIMTDPVIGPDGHTYERGAIELWLSQHGTSPITRERMTHTNLVPNFALRTAIEEYQARPAGSTAPAPAPAPTAASAAPTPGAGAGATRAGKTLQSADFPLKLALTSGNIADQRVGMLSIDVELPGGAVPAREALPRHLMCILDVSESMNEIAKMKDNKSVEKAAELTRLDLVAHSVRTIVHMLGANDTLSIITFGDTATNLLPRTHMSAAGKKQAETAIAGIRAAGGTNMWDGLRLALSKLDEYHDHVTMLLLSDGQPSINPPRGTLKTYQMIAKSKANAHTLHTFGYGYGLEYGLLDQLALQGRGLYAYIPDASMVGTVFVNFVANLLCTALYNLSLSIKCSQGSLSVLVPTTDAAQTHTVAAGSGVAGPFVLGSLQLASPRTLCLLMSPDAVGELTVVCTDSPTCTPHTIALSAPSPSPSPSPSLAALGFAFARHLSLQTLKSTVADIAGGRVPIKDASARLSPLVKHLDAIRATAGSEQLDALIEDLTSGRPESGQLGKAMARADWWEQWGQHYLPAALRAHELEMCMNFKDASQQHYGGAHFVQHQEHAEQLFCALPPPKALARVAAAAAAATTTYQWERAAPAVTMGHYYDRGGGCFSGDSVAVLADGTRVPIHALRRGDVVRTRTGTARVECLVVSLLTGPVNMVTLSDSLRITSWHPVLGHNARTWHFPAMLDTPQRSAEGVVYNVVLESGATNMQVGTHFCASLGHGVTNSPVASHPFFSSNVRTQLQCMHGWRDGLIFIDSALTVRCPTTDHILSWGEAGPDATAKAMTLFMQDSMLVRVGEESVVAAFDSQVPLLIVA